jgi:hypothetical protein
VTVSLIHLILQFETKVLSTKARRNPVATTGKKMPSKKNLESEVRHHPRPTCGICIFMGYFQNLRHMDVPSFHQPSEEVSIAGILCVPLISRNKVKILGALQVMPSAIGIILTRAKCVLHR